MPIKRGNIHSVLFILILSFLSISSVATSQYDEEAREAERLAKAQEERVKRNPAKGFVSGVKEATYDSTKGLLSDTAASTVTEAPLIGTIEGARQGTGKVLDHTVKGAYRIATLGFGELDEYEVEEPESGSGEPTKIKIKIPGT